MEAGCLANGSPETPLLAQGKQPALRPLRHSSAKCIPAPVACTYESGQRQHLSCLAHGSPETPLLAQLRQAASSQATLPLLRQMQLSQATPPLHCSAPVACSACVCVCACMHAFSAMRYMSSKCMPLQRQALHACPCVAYMSMHVIYACHVLQRQALHVCLQRQALHV